MQFLKSNKKRLLVVGFTILWLLIILWAVLRVFVAQDPDPIVSGQAQVMDPAQPEDHPNSAGEPVYSLATLYPQEPITVDGQAQLQTDQSYFYEPDRGQIVSVQVRDGQFVRKGDLLFTYQTDKDQARYDLEDALREQTRLYNQRETLISQLQAATGELYNYRGDRIGYYYDENGQRTYVVEEPIGKGSLPPTSTEASSEAQVSSEESSTGEAGADSSGIKDQIRQVNQSIEDVEIKLIRLKEQQQGQVTARSNGRALVDLRGQDSSSYPLVRLISDEVSVTGSVSEYDFHLLSQDRPVSLYVNAEDRQVPGTLIAYDQVPKGQQANPSGEGDGGINTSAPDSSNKAVRYGFIIQPDDFIQPGFTVQVQMTLPGLVIPQQALLEEGDQNYVFLYKHGKAHRLAIKPVRQGIQWVVLRDLDPGDQLILNPHGLEDGQAIQVIDPHDPAMMEGALMEGEMSDE